MFLSRNLRLASTLILGLTVAGLITGPAIFSRILNSRPAPVPSTQSAPLHRTFFLRGSAFTGWNDSKPGPFLSAVSGDTVTLMLISEDGLEHVWFIDFDNNGMLDPNETATQSPGFISTTTYLNYTFKPVIGTNIPHGGNWTYRCAFHPLTMFGTIRIIPAQILGSVSSSFTLSGARVSTTGPVAVDARTLVLSGNITVTATNSTTGALLFNKQYNVTNIQMKHVSGTTTLLARFLLNAAIKPYALSSDITVQLNSLTVSTSTILTRELDIANASKTSGTGLVTITDLSIVALAFNSMIGSSKYNPLADVDANGVVNITDLSIVALYLFDASYF